MFDTIGRGVVLLLAAIAACFIPVLIAVHPGDAVTSGGVGFWLGLAVAVLQLFATCVAVVVSMCVLDL